MKKAIALLLIALIALFTFAACGGSKTYICAGCGKECTLSEGMENPGKDAVLYCEDCMNKPEFREFEEGLASQIHQYESEALSQQAEREGA